MKQEDCLRLNALLARGPAAYTGAPLASLLVEVRGGRLYITGVTPLEDDGERYTGPGREYGYILEGGEAEKLLSALARYDGGHPERLIASSFEFSRPRCPLGDYLDSLGIAYRYWEAGGG